MRHSLHQLKTSIVFLVEEMEEETMTIEEVEGWGGNDQVHGPSTCIFKWGLYKKAGEDR